MRRVFLVALLGLAASIARGQVFEALRTTARTLQDRGLIPREIQRPPIQDVGHSAPPPRVGTLPPPEEIGEGSDELQIVEAGDIEQQGSIVRLTGGAELVFRGYRIFAREIAFDKATQIADARGDVRLIGQDAVITGERVLVNFETRFFQAFDAWAQLEPELLRGQLIAPLYVRGRETEGTEREIRGIDSRSTTCNYEKPHFEILSRHLTVRPGRRAIFRDVELRILDRRIVKLPYLSVPLSEPSYRYLPEVGHSRIEGYFIKTRWGIPFRGNNNFDARVDYYTKLGAGLGGDFTYENPNLRGVLRLFGITGAPNTVLLNSQHYQELPWGQLTLENGYSRNDYLVSPGTTIVNSRAGLVIPQGKSRTILNWFRSSSASGEFASLQQNVGISDRRVFSRLFNTNLDLNWVNSSSRFGGPEPIERQQVDLRFRGNYDLQKAIALLEYQRAIPVGEVDNFFSASDRTPLFSLTSDDRRLFGDRFRALPFNTELSIGEFSNPIDRSRISRGMFDFAFRRPDAGRRRLSLSLSGRFRQSMYSDDTAQYTLSFSPQLRYRIGRDTEANLRWNYLRPYGFTPLAIDRSGRTNLYTADVSFRPLRSFKIGAQTGYDALRLERSDVAWQSLGVRMEYDPTHYLQARALLTYDPNQAAWSNLRFDLGYRPGATFVGLGARYDGIRHVWGNVNLLVQGLKWGRLSANALLNYNGFLKRFESQQFSFNYDLHDAELILQISDTPVGFRSGREISLFLRLKALPFTTPFGIGRQGQPLGIGTGRDY